MMAANASNIAMCSCRAWSTRVPMRLLAAYPTHPRLPAKRPLLNVTPDRADSASVDRHLWLSDHGQPLIDVAACPDIIAAQHRADRLLRRHTPQELILGLQAAIKAIPAWPSSPSAITQHWRHRLLVLQTTNRHRGVPAEPATLMDAAVYPNAVTAAAAILSRPVR
jgi:hypothetical protein